MGYSGRTAVAEIIDDELREIIAAREPIRALNELARRGGTRFLREAAIELVREGKTSPEEINRASASRLKWTDERLPICTRKELLAQELGEFAKLKSNAMGPGRGAGEASSIEGHPGSPSGETPAS